MSRERLVLALLLLFSPLFVGCGKGLGAASGSEVPEDPEGDGPGPVSDSPITPSGAARGTRVTITGEGFLEGMTVTIGGVNCDSITVSSSSELTCVIGAHRAGLADLLLSRPGGVSTSVANAFQYKSFLYVANNGSNSISAFTINGANGLGTAISGQPFDAVSSPTQLQLDIATRRLFVYTIVPSHQGVSVFDINPETGALSQISNSPFDLDFYTNNILLSLAGDFLHVALSSGLGVSMGSYIVTSSGAPTNFTSVNDGHNGTKLIQTRDGASIYQLVAGNKVRSLRNVIGTSVDAFTETVNSPITLGAAVSDLAVASNGQFVFAALPTAQGVSVIGRSLTTGQFASENTLPVSESGVFYLTAHPTEDILYAVFSSANSGIVLSWRSGGVSEIGSFATGTEPRRVAVDGAGAFAYVANRGADTVGYYDIQSDGNLSLTGSMNAGIHPTDLTVY